MKLSFLTLFLTLFICIDLPTGGASALPTPCRAWINHCSDYQQYVCTTEEQYQLFLLESASLRCQNVSTTPNPSPLGVCMLINGSCQFTSIVPTCATWQVGCTPEYACGTLQQYENTISCPYLLGTPPSPEEICTPIELSCNWFQPCHSWQDHCNGPYQCGTLSEYWTFMNSPQPSCARTSSDVYRIPPGECIVQDGHCSWSNCMAWTNYCHTSWLCGTEHSNRLYQVLPPPPCPPTESVYLSPEQPGVCSYNPAFGQCQFVQDPCENVTCAAGHRCKVHQPTHEAYCEALCTVQNGGCPAGFDCAIQEVSCEVPPCVSSVVCTLNISSPCPDGKVFISCGSACPPTCDSSNVACTFNCVPGCFCPSGMVDHNGTCIDPLQCPNAQDTQCSGGKVYTDCGSACPTTCETYGRELSCPAVCVSGCFCPVGTVDNHGTCIDPMQCSNVSGMQCSGGKEYSDCGSACPVTCENRESLMVCPQICLTGCFCPIGTVDNNGTCIDPLLCPDSQNAHPECSDGKVFTPCGSACPPTCDSSNVACTFNCVPGCFCPSGMVDHNGTCIDPLQCPNAQDTQCSGGKVYTDCGSACPTTCETYGRELSCPAVCVSGCFCPVGTVDNHGTCIDPMQCSNASGTQCSGGKEYSDCGSACPVTCENRESLMVCPQICMAGCFCPIGTVDNNGTCIDPLLCPDSQDAHPECSNGKVFTSCGSACPPTCDSSNVACTFNCVPGCFCPSGMVDHNGTCIDPLQCPNAQDTQCSGGKVYTDCGSACPTTCETYGRELSCPAVCVSGCYCPVGTEDKNGTCIDPLQCPTLQDLNEAFSSVQKKFIIIGIVVAVLSTVLLAVTLIILRRRLTRRGQYAAVVLVNEECTKNAIEVQDMRDSKYIGVSVIASRGNQHHI